ncbi:DDE-type integrase/transposase/recombinase [Nonomuraea sp. KM90]|uniref:DDE-type integrase/transposase/recombinase n=1 Tax=Nonomuraea sp. KM90 TaxID=3457428 RepID=UPI003FCCB22B
MHEIVRNLDPALAEVGVEGSKRYREVYKLVHRREASSPNQIWQADHTELDLWVLDPKGQQARPWLTAIEDDHSHAIAGYAVNLEAPSALSTALAFRQAIWRKAEPLWHVCGIPEVFHLDHGPDFTSAHLEQVMADLRVRPVFSKKGQPNGHGKIERFMETMNQMCLAHLPGYAPKGSKDRAAQAKLTLAGLDEAIGRFIREVYNLRPHAETCLPPQDRWEAGAFIPRMPDSLEQSGPAVMHRRQTAQGSHRRHPVPRPALHRPGPGRLRRRTGHHPLRPPRHHRDLRLPAPPRRHRRHLPVPGYLPATIRPDRQPQRDHRRAQRPPQITTRPAHHPSHSRRHPAGPARRTAARRLSGHHRAAPMDHPWPSLPADNTGDAGDTSTLGDGPRLKRYWNE